MAISATAAGTGGRGGRGLAGSILALSLTIAGLGAGTPAHAGTGERVANPVRVAATSATNSFNKSVVVSCPAGQRVYSAAGEISGAVGNVTMERIVPSAGLTSVLVSAAENGAFAGNWNVTAYAICGPNTLNLQRIQVTSATNSFNKTVFAGCPAGLRLYGLGAEILGGFGNVFLDDLTPNVALTGVTVTAFENGAFAGNWTLTGYAVCGNPAAVMTRVAATSLIDSLFVKSVTATCPAGTHVHGVGAQLDGAFGSVVIDDLRPNVGLLSGTATGTENVAFAGNWQITTFAICST